MFKNWSKKQRIIFFSIAIAVLLMIAYATTTKEVQKDGLSEEEKKAIEDRLGGGQELSSREKKEIENSLGNNPVNLSESEKKEIENKIQGNL